MFEEYIEDVKHEFTYRIDEYQGRTVTEVVEETEVVRNRLLNILQPWEIALNMDW